MDVVTPNRDYFLYDCQDSVVFRTALVLRHRFPCYLIAVYLPDQRSGLFSAAMRVAAMINSGKYSANQATVASRPEGDIDLGSASDSSKLIRPRKRNCQSRCIATVDPHSRNRHRLGRCNWGTCNRDDRPSRNAPAGTRQDPSAASLSTRRYRRSSGIPPPGRPRP